jgi:hypothetical protein
MRDYFDAVSFMPLTDDHCCGCGDLFGLELKHHGEGRIKIRELWVPSWAARASP